MNKLGFFLVVLGLILSMFKIKFGLLIWASAPLLLLILLSLILRKEMGFWNIFTLLIILNLVLSTMLR